MRIVSLGGDCQPAFHIRRLIPAAEKHFFDWLVVPARAVISLIENDFSNYAQPDALQAFYTDKQELYAVEEKRYGIHMLHDYKAFDDENKHRVIEKYAYLGHKFQNLRKGPVTFVRQVHDCDGDTVARWAAASELAACMRRFNPQSQLLYLHQEATKVQVEPGIKIVYLKKTGDDWTGDWPSWNVFLSNLLQSVNLSQALD